MKNRSKIFYTIASIILGMLVGAIILLSINVSPIKAYEVIIKGAFGNPKYVSWTLTQAVPIILTGISVAFAFNTGLFNIGAEGQYIVGSIGAIIAGLVLKLPPIIHPIVALSAGILCGVAWGGLVGLLKSKFGVNEVISSIMLNWIALFLNNYMLTMKFLRKPQTDNSFSILKSASIRILGNWKTSEQGMEFLKNNKFLRDMLNPPINWGIILSILAAFLAWYILKKTSLGYQLKAVGFNKDAAEYGGINIKRNMLTSMMIAGAFSGLAGAITVLGVSENIGILAGQEGYGFNGIAVALIAGNAPLATIPAGILFSALRYGGGKLNSRLNTPSEVINITIGIIVLFISMPKLLDMAMNFYQRTFKKKKVIKSE